MARLSFPVPIHLTSQKAQGLSNFYVSKTLKCGGVARGVSTPDLELYRSRFAQQLTILLTHAAIGCMDIK